MQEAAANPAKTGIAKIIGWVLAGLCILISLFHIFVAVDSSITVVQQRVIHVMAILLVYFLINIDKQASKSKWRAIVNGLFFILACVLAVYFIQGNTLSALSQRGVRGITETDMVFGIILILTILYVGWRSVGPR